MRKLLLTSDVVFGFGELSVNIEEGGESKNVCLRIFNEATLEIPIDIRLSMPEDIQGLHDSLSFTNSITFFIFH